MGLIFFGLPCRKDIKESMDGSMNWKLPYITEKNIENGITHHTNRQTSAGKLNRRKGRPLLIE